MADRRGCSLAQAGARAGLRSNGAGRQRGVHSYITKPVTGENLPRTPGPRRQGTAIPSYPMPPRNGTHNIRSGGPPIR